jgi:colanic acid/amylovoran biosynthesis protein
MRILLTNFYSRQNKGDAAIMAVLIRELRNRDRNIVLHISTMENSSHCPEFENIPLTTSFFYEAIYRSANPLVRIIATFSILSYSTVWAITKRFFNIPISIFPSIRLKKLMEEFFLADAVICTGGGYLSQNTSIRGYVILLLHLQNIFIARILGKTCILSPQSIGSFTNKTQSWYTSKILNMANLIIARDAQTGQCLKTMGINRFHIQESVDLAFLLTSMKKSSVKLLLQKKGIVLSRPIVMITVKGFSSPTRVKYEKTIAEFADYLISQTDNQVIMVPQSTSTLHKDDDRDVISRIQRQMHHRADVICILEDLTYQETACLYGYASLLIATRMHSAIFALLHHVYTIAIAYEPKTIGMMEMLGLRKWVLPLEELTFERLRLKYSQFLKEKITYRKNLIHYLPLTISKAKTSIVSIHETLLQAVDSIYIHGYLGN